MAGSFAVFEELGIKNTFDISASIFAPEYLQFLDINVLNFQIPDMTSAKPNDWNKENKIKENRFKEILKKHEIRNNETKKLFKNNSKDYFNKLFELRGIKKEKIPEIKNLFKNIKYHFLNQNIFGNFKEFPTNNKLIYIGGIIVENRGILLNKIKNEKKQQNCVVFVSFGTVNLTKGMVEDNVEGMLNLFKKFDQCIFKVRIEGKYLKYSKKNLKLLTNMLNNNIYYLAKENTKLFISHCGQNSINEVIFNLI
ncbi:hypothetical protein Mgra_00008724 [Meloidogyne graminicola]|uniref:glucuronosyltransferase n=1 Tax=Meloidogyne graminicola TaxID=189291 RepID=A0A8S9ZEV4_9BILA|nr:hypothetical protein Mgra_00008724 [Meloidogyne graminicola]